MWADFRSLDVQCLPFGSHYARAREERDEPRRAEPFRPRDDVRLEELVPFLAFGTFAPSRRASDRPIAIACLRLVTFFPERPERSPPRFISCIARWTFFPAFLPYLRPLRRVANLHLASTRGDHSPERIPRMPDRPRRAVPVGWVGSESNALPRASSAEAARAPEGYGGCACCDKAPRASTWPHKVGQKAAPGGRSG